ncbi:MAG: family 16 glycoside hydrolase [Verrucomicrobiota bacterium]
MIQRPTLLLLGLALAAAPYSFADEHGELIFEDDFERSESQETKDEPGNGWNTNSEKRAKGDKQVDLRDGAMYIFISPKADHGVSVTHDAEFEDGAVGLRFMLEDKKDSLGLNFADLKYKKVHAGHICAARIHTHQVQLQDLKTGNMDLAIRTARTGAGLSNAQKEMLKGKSATVQNQLAVGEWHDLLVKIAGETMTVTINGKEVGSFTSEGIGHETKRTLRLAVPKDAVVDDLKIWRAK